MALNGGSQIPHRNTAYHAVHLRDLRRLCSCALHCFHQVFGFPPTEYHMLGKVEEELEPFFKLWNMISDFHASRKEWLHGSFLGACTQLPAETRYS